jgi:transcriptional regulator with XRE-family HTH domain
MLIADLHESLRQHVLATIKSKQLNQRELAELIGMRQAHISNFVLGRRGFSIDGMDAILKVLGLDVTSLLAMPGQTPSPKDCSTTLESVPLIQLRAAMNPTFAKDDLRGELGFTKSLLRRLNADSIEVRKPWVRFIAIRADGALAAPMHPRLSNGSVVLVDRHYCSLAEYQKNEPNLYLIRKEQTLMVRWIEMQGGNLCLRPDSSEYPLDFICIDRKNPLTSCIVGRVAHIATELGSPVRRRPLSL